MIDRYCLTVANKNCRTPGKSKNLLAVSIYAAAYIPSFLESELQRNCCCLKLTLCYRQMFNWFAKEEKCIFYVHTQWIVYQIVNVIRFTKKPAYNLYPTAVISDDVFIEVKHFFLMREMLMPFHGYVLHNDERMK